MKLNFDYEETYKYCLLKADYYYHDKNLEEKKIIAKKYLKEMEICEWKYDIYNKLMQQDYAIPAYASYYANLLIDNIPEELLSNVQEWLDDKEISNILYNGLSIKMIMDINEHEGNHIGFLTAAERMIKYIQGGCINPDGFIFVHRYEVR